MLEKTLKQLPNLPGVYKFYNDLDQLLYVGKAKILKNRVKSYFRFTPSLSKATNLSPRISKMIDEVAKLEYIVSSNEYDALILENSLIKELKPKYNILLRDDKTYPYICLNLEEKYPRFEITRKIVKNSKIKYFGPFANGSRDILEALYLCFKLVQKKSCIQGKRTCLFFQIGKCLGPCEEKISQQEYLNIVQEAKNALVDRKKLILKLNEKMQLASSMLNFEEAAKLRDMQESIKKSLHVIELDLAKIENFDLLAIEFEGNVASFVFLFIRDGKVISNITKIVKNSLDFEINELYEKALIQFYKTNIYNIPKAIYVADTFEGKEELSQYFSHKYGYKIQINVPQKGEKLALCNVARENAKENLKNYLSNHQDDIQNEIQKFFDLAKRPIRIEIFDNSHHAGDSPIGAMVVFEDKFLKEDYRIFNLQTKDEYSQMREVLSRRIEKFHENVAPDLWILDGGATLLKLAKELLEKANIHIDLLAISKEKHDAKANRSKGKAKDIIYTKDLSYKLQTTDKKLQFIQKLRDEAHRFAIHSHRRKKSTKDLSSDLSQIPNIGPSSIKKLLSYFGTFERIYSASLEELEGVIGEKKAKEIFFFVTK